MLEVVAGEAAPSPGLVLANVSSLSPHFTVTGLHPGREVAHHKNISTVIIKYFCQVRLVITAENSNGKSEAVVLDVFTSKVAQLQVGEQKMLSGLVHLFN